MVPAAAADAAASAAASATVGAPSSPDGNAVHLISAPACIKEMLRVHLKSVPACI